MNGGTIAHRGIASDVRSLVADALDVYGDDERARALLTDLARRLDEPLRVAIAGMVKAGKSTLVNALIGEEIAPTDAGECTRVVTWYRFGPAPSVTLVPMVGAPRSLPVRRVDGRLILDLDGVPTAEVDHLVVEWPAVSLRDIVIIDTPGTASLSTEVSARTVSALTRTDVPAEADAVVYLMRHLRAADAEFLEAFREVVGAGMTSNAIAVLSRADELGGGRIDALVSAHDVAERIRRDGALMELAVGIVPVAGLLAQSARTLRQAEFEALQSLAALPREETDLLLMSADRFRSKASVLEERTREALLDRFGIFGIRLALVLLRGGVSQPTQLARQLADRSGLGELIRLVGAQFYSRAEDIKARAAVVALDRLLRAKPRSDAARLEYSMERIKVAAHEFEELALLGRARSGGLGLPADAAALAVRILGGHGTSPEDRMGLPGGSATADLRAAALESLRRWRALEASPFTSRAVASVCGSIARSCEGVLAGLAAEDDVWDGLGAEPGVDSRAQADNERRAG